MATIKKAQSGAKTKTKTPEEKNIFGGSYVAPYSAKRTAKNIVNKIGRGIQAIGDPIVSAGHRLGNAVEGAYELQKKGTKEAFKNAIKKNGGAVKKKMKNGGSLTGLKASTKRVGPVDPKGAFTKVQKKTLAGATTTAKLTKDKQLGATKMAKSGAKVAKDGKWIQKAINPAHKGYCTPETKATCTPKRKALAHTLRKMAKKK